MCAKLNDMLKHFTTDASSTQIHCCYYGKIVSEYSYSTGTLLISTFEIFKKGRLSAPFYKKIHSSKRLWRLYVFFPLEH